MNPPRLLLFHYCLVPALHLLGVAVLSQASFLYHFCINDAGNYTSNSTYEANLDTLLNSLTSHSQIDYGFYNFSAGQGSDQVNAIALCIGDILPDACRGCINNSTIRLTNLCPKQKQAMVWYDECMLRYSDDSIFGKSQTSPAFYMWNRHNTSDVEEFNQVLGNLMTNLRNKAASGDWRYKFATGKANACSFETIYGLMQCTPDLSELSCSNCLEGATNEIPVCCAGKRGGKVVRPSCNLRYETFHFYEFAAANAPPPPSVNTPFPSNTTSTKGKNGNTSRTVVLVVGCFSNIHHHLHMPLL